MTSPIREHLTTSQTAVQPSTSRQIADETSTALDALATLAGMSSPTRKRKLKASPPLHHAVFKEDIHNVKLLLNKYDVNSVDTNGSTPLHIAIENGKDAIAKILLEHGAKLDVYNINGLTPLHLAAVTGNANATTLLLESGARVDVIDKKGTTPLHFAANQENRDLVLELLKYGAKKDALDHERRTPLHYAAESGNSGIIDLIAEPSIIDSRDLQGLTAFHLTILTRDEKTAFELINLHADINIPDIKEDTPLHTSMKCRISLITLLLENQADVNAQNESGSTPLHTAIGELQNEESASLLIEYGSDINARDKEKFTPLHVAAMFGYYGLVSLLLSKGADINAQMEEKLTPCHLALESLSEDSCRDPIPLLKVVSTLLLRGMDLNLWDENHNSVTDKIAKWKSDRIMQFISLHNEEELGKLLSFYELENKINNDSIHLLIPAIPSLYLCMYSLLTNSQRFIEISPLFTDLQLQNLMNIWKHHKKEDFSKRLCSLPSEALCRCAPWLEKEDLKGVQEQVYSYLNGISDLEKLNHLRARLDLLTSKNVVDAESFIEKEIIPLLNDLKRSMRALSTWVEKDDKITSIIDFFFHAHICSSYTNICKMHQELEKFHSEIAKSLPYNDEDADIFSSLINWDISSPSQYEERFGCQANHFYAYGIFQMKDLTTLGLGNELENLINEIIIINNNNIEEIFGWERKHTEEINSTLSKITTEEDTKVIKEFLDLFKELKKQPSIELLNQLKQVDRRRRLVYLKAYLSQKGVDQVLGNDSYSPSNSLSEWASNHPELKGPDFYDLENSINSNNPREPIASTSSQK